MDSSLQDFVSRQYASPQDYFSSYREYIHNSLLQGVSRITNSVIRVYADNETLINGSEFARLSTVSQEPWYQQYTAAVSYTHLPAVGRNMPLEIPLSAQNVHKKGFAAAARFTVCAVIGLSLIHI